tara:strand:- start:24862 stop:25131 length:270 start_codon:yes stop_codon:yes gene_type:complete
MMTFKRLEDKSRYPQDVFMNLASPKRRGLTIIPVILNPDSQTSCIANQPIDRYGFKPIVLGKGQRGYLSWQKRKFTYCTRANMAKAISC